MVEFSDCLFDLRSEPFNLGAPINSTGSDQNAFLTKDGLTLYFSSDRAVAGAKGGLDIWVSQRATTADAWGTPQNVEALNTSSGDLAPNLGSRRRVSLADS